MERRVIFTDPNTGQQKVKITSPRGNTILRIEPVDQPARHAFSHHSGNSITPNRVNNSMRYTPKRANNPSKLISTPSRLMTPSKTPSRTPTRAGYSPGGLYMQNKQLSPYNYTPGGT